MPEELYMAPAENGQREKNDRSEINGLHKEVGTGARS